MRTAQDVFEDFRKLGYVDIYKDNYHTVLALIFRNGEYIEISRKERTIKTSDFKLIKIKELKLLYELCAIWGWINENRKTGFR